MPERFLILGTTGVAKSRALAQLAKYVESQAVDIKYKTIDFESEFLKPVLDENDKDLFSYLDDTNLRQRELWLEAWVRFKSVFEKNTDQYILLCLHGVLTREYTGTRSPINIQSIIEFAPTKIITLIDDVYMKWHRTQERSKGESRRGQPTLEQLLDARRAEIFIGDFIAGHQKVKPRHYILSVHHPARTLYRLLFVSKDIRTVYLSFPISGPRRLLKDGDVSGISEVNNFLKIVNEFELKHQKVTCFCPLTIDELPLILTSEDRGNEEEEHKIEFSFEKNRWNVRDFWGDEILLCNDCPSVISIPAKQIKESSGFIKSDVGLRDYRLVRQAKYLVVFNPWFQNQETAGVRNEISMATLRGTPVYIYQDPRHDSEGNAKKSLMPRPGSLGGDPRARGITFYDSIEKALQQILV
ncbi:MAG: hypothetical protein M0Z35_21590 [Desulfitobacterium hafniense]|nr:hypothetical protein [Desulfitobacterium hafniense]